MKKYADHYYDPLHLVKHLHANIGWSNAVGPFIEVDEGLRRRFLAVIEQSEARGKVGVMSDIPLGISSYINANGKPENSYISGAELDVSPKRAFPAQEAEPGENRLTWTFKQWWEHVGAWETAEGHISFGSPMAVRAMLIQFGNTYTAQAAPAETPNPDTRTLDAVNKAFDAAAEIAIRHTGIPPDALRRGTGVRDRIVIEGENIAAAIRALKFRPQPVDAAQAVPEGREDDFAKIVRGSNGQQVLFYREDSNEHENTLHCLASYEGVQADLKLGGLPDDAFAAALDKADVKMADQVLGQFCDLGLAQPTDTTKGA